jgi:dTMP kinase
MSRSRVYCIDGIDGTGKTTLIEYLKYRLNAEGLKVSVYSDFHYGQSSKELGMVLRRHATDMSPLAQLCTIIAMRDAGTSEFIKYNVLEDTIVLVDRGVLSTIAYQIYGLPMLDSERDRLMWLLDKLSSSINRLIPDITFVLSLPLEVVKSRLDERKRDALETRDDDSWERIAWAYNNVHIQDRIVRVDVHNKSKQQVADEVYKCMMLD